MNPRFPRLRPAATIVAILALLAGCATQPPSAPMRRPADTRADIVRRLPDGVKDREGWATDITAAFSALGIEPTTQNLCASLAVIGQESTFVVDPTVPGLGRIARAEIDRRATDHHIPQLLVHGALAVTSSDGRSYADRIATARTERELSLAYEDLIDRIPLGQRLFAGSNPIRTAGPMQVSVDFAERHAREHGYPYATKESVRHELFTRRGGVYFGIAHLLGYPANYDRMVYRFADFNAGFYASRNAAFQNAVSLASGIPLALDGDLVAYGSGKPGATELATRTLSKRIGMGDGQIRRALDLGESPEFERSTLYERVFALAEQVERKPLPRATMPRIALDSPKITRKLTTEWFANRVDQRYRACLAKAPAIERPS